MPKHALSCLCRLCLRAVNGTDQHVNVDVKEDITCDEMLMQSQREITIKSSVLLECSDSGEPVNEISIICLSENQISNAEACDVMVQSVRPNIGAVPINVGLGNVCGSSVENQTWKDLVKEIHERLESLPLGHDLFFRYPPTSLNDRYSFASSESVLRGNWGRFGLKNEHPNNQQFLNCQSYLIDTIATVEGLPVAEYSAVQDIINTLRNALIRLDEDRAKKWDLARLDKFSKRRNNSEVLVAFRGSDRHPTVELVAVLACFFNSYFHLNRRATNVLLKLFSGLICSSDSSSFGGHPIPPLKSFPSDLRAAQVILGLEPDLTLFACCPSCFALYKPGVYKSAEIKPEGHSSQTTRAISSSNYPVYCTHQNTPKGPVCGALLIRQTEANGNGLKEIHIEERQHNDIPSVLKIYRPSRVFPYHKVKSWLARLLSQPGLEQILDSRWEEHKGRVPEVVRDIWDSEGVRNFLGPDGLKFGCCKKGEGRYLLGVFVDFFNPWGNKQAGKVASVGVIFLICLNLPLSMRFRSEYMHLAGVIPGPKAPSKDQINHLILPLVLELRTLWYNGIEYSCTPLYPGGKLVRAALLPFITDLGARKAVGLASYSHRLFCPYDQLEKKNISNLDISSWPRRSSDEHRRLLADWRYATDGLERERLFTAHGVRWTPMYLLEYYDVPRNIVVDAMHNLLLGLVQTHIRVVLGMTVKGVTDDAEHISPPREDELTKAVQLVLDDGASFAMLKRYCRKVVLVQLCRNFHLDDRGEKKILAVRLKSASAMIKVSSGLCPVQDATTEAATKIALKLSPLLDLHVLQEVWNDMAKTKLPTWMKAAPRHVGEPGHGKLSADEWRTLACVHLPITLIRIWSCPVGNERQQKALDNFMNLVSAISIGTARSTSKDRAEYYTKYMVKYLGGLLDISLYGHFKLRPNHHTALHLEEFLNRFGPAHSYWAFAFERQIGLLRNVKTNQHHEHMAVSLMRHFTMSANLKALLKSNNFPLPFETLRRILMADNENRQGTFTAEVKGSRYSAESFMELDYDKAERLGPLIYEKLLTFCRRRYPIVNFRHESEDKNLESSVMLPNLAQRLKRIEHCGVHFTTLQINKADSSIIFHEKGSLHAACIVDIIVHARPPSISSREKKDFIHTVFAVVRRFANCSDSIAGDPFQAYPILRSSIYSCSLRDNEEIILFKDIISHFASCRITDANWVSKSKSAMVVIALDRE